MNADSENTTQSAAGFAGGGVSPLTIIWRKKLILLIVFVLFAATAAGLSTSVLDDEYETTASLLVTQAQSKASFDQVQAGEVLGRTYAEVVHSESVADLVAKRLPFQTTGGQVKSQVSFEPVPETLLVRITAVAPDAVQAQQIANTYASVVVDYAGSRLNQTNGGQVSVADQATRPDQPARPRPTLYTLLAGLIGLVVGSALALLAGLLDRRVRSLDELQEITGVPVLANIALARSRRSRQLNEEAYRVLRTNLDFLRPGKPLRSVAVVSASEGEGKSSAVVNLARAVAEIGDSTIIIEGDLRRPAVQAALVTGQPERLSPGLSNYLAGSASLDEIIYETDLPNVRLIPSGPTPPSPSALLDSELGHRLLNLLAEQSDLVIVDTPPMSVGADATLLAAPADETVMVVDLRKSSKTAIRAVVAQLNFVKASFAGVLVNRVRDSSDDAYNYGYYGEAKPNKRRFRRKTRQSEGTRAPDILPPKPAQPDQSTDLEQDEGHDYVGAGRIFAEAGDEEPSQRSYDR